MKDSFRSIPSKISAIRHDTNEFLVKKMREKGWKYISPSHGGIIYLLLSYEVLSMKEIAEKVKRDPSTVTTLVNKLVKLGYAEYSKNPNDLRSKQVSLTQKGRDIDDEFEKISLEVTNKLLENISDDEIEMFLSTLNKMNKNMEDGLKK